jgi:hypothetical protein
MLTDVQIINLGLAKLAATPIKRIDFPVTPIESYMASNYPQWRRQELAKRRWVFALEYEYPLTLNDTLPDSAKPYKFGLPIDCLRPIRGRGTEWEQRGHYLYSGSDTLKLNYVKNVPESEFDTLFNEVLACKIAVESCDYITQSNTKKESLKEDYKTALMEAARNNAFVIGPENIHNDETSSWLLGRHYG